MLIFFLYTCFLGLQGVPGLNFCEFMIEVAKQEIPLNWALQTNLQQQK